MELTGNEEKDAFFIEVAERLGIQGDCVSLLIRFLNTTSELTNTLFNLTKHDGYESTNEILACIEQNLVLAERFLREEAFVELSQAKQERGEYFKFDAPIPDGFLMECGNDGAQMEFPLWLFGHRKPKDLPPSFHKKRAYVREQVFWNALIRRMLDEKQIFGIRRNIPEHARIKVRFETRPWNARDLDHYCLSPLINSLVYNGLLFSDHPSRVSYEITWQETLPSDERVCISVNYLDSRL